MKTVKRFIALAISAAMTMSLVNGVLPAFAEGESGAPYNASPSAPTGLLTNELENPLNVEEPTFGWLVNDTDQNEIQTAYELVITDEVTGDVVWDSGKVESSEQSYVGMVEGEPINDDPDDGDILPITFGYAMQSGKLTEVDAYRNESTSAATVYIALYDGNKSLTRLVTKPLEAGEADTEENYTLSENDVVELSQGGLIKLFAWEQGSEGTTMKPLSETVEIDGISAGSAHGSSSNDNIDSLETAHPYSWKVRTWDKGDEVSPYSASAYFTTGLSDNDWIEAEWISDGTTGAEKAEGTYNHYWYVRTNKALTKNVKAATAYFSGVHDYDLYVNGTEIGRGQSFDYSSEARYQGWDITDAVKSNAGSISIGALVRTYGGGQGRAPGNAAFIGYVKLYYTDGTSDIIATNTTDWTISKTTPYKENGTTRNGEGDFVEEYTASNAQNFTNPSFDASSWAAASERVSGTKATYKGTEIDDGIITDTPIAELSKVTSYLVKPVSIEKLSDGTTVADFGVVIPARPVITFKNADSRTVTVTGGYLLTSDGKVATGDKPQQSTTMTWTYKQNGTGEQTFRAWDHLGFRYLQIPSCGETFTADTLQAAVVHTNVPDGRQSTLVTSNETLNNVYTLMQRSSLYGIQNEFVDTPTREKGQFTDDARNISEASMATQFEREASRKAIMQFLASADRFWTDSEGNLTGRVNSVYPNVEGGRDIPEYSVNIPQWVWNYYMQTGDKATLEYAYPYMLATADYLTKYTSNATGLVERLAGGDTNPNDYQYGIVDWPASGRFGYDWKNTQKGAFATVNMLSKHAYDVVALAAAELGYSEDVTDMQSRSAALKAAINNKMFNTTKGLYCDGTTDTSGTQSSHISQHANSYALAFDIVEEENKEAVAEYVASQGMKQGPMTADILAKGLFNGGQDTAALKLFINENDYGWAKTLKQGGSFTWESWVADGSSVNDSQSHAWGATAASDILRNFAGVQILEPGASKVKIAPVYVDLTSLNATVQTERGGVGVSYMRTEPTEDNPDIENTYSITITIPANMTAEVELPDIGTGTYKAGSKTGTAVENSFTLGSGTYTYVFDGEITPPEKIDTKVYDEETYNFKTLPSDLAGDYVYNDYITLHFGANGAVSADDGFNMYKNSTDNAYLIFTPAADGTVEITGKVRGNASTLYVTETESSAKTGSTTDATVLRSVGRDSATTGMGSMKVEAGKTYYFYNTGGTSSANPTSITTFTYTHEHIPLVGITGSADTANKLYTWKIGDEDEENTENKYTCSDDYASITVGIDAADTMSEEKGIVYAGTPVPDSGGLTTRYIIVEPKVSGTFTMNATGNGTQNNRVYYKNFGTGEVNLSTCTKDTANDGVSVAKQLEAGVAADVTVAMTAGNKYVVYLYTNKSGGSVSAMSYAYDAEPDTEPVPTENIPYEAPDAAKTVTEAVGDAITLDRDTYPLVVGSTSKTTYADWETNGSEITIAASLSSGDVSNLKWSVDDTDIAYISSSTDTGVGSVRVKGKRTGATRLVASLSETEKAVCDLVVIDNVTRSTVQTLSFNTDAITLAKDNTATLIPIITPKDVFGNGALNADLGWASSDNNIATVSDGVVTAVAPGTATIMAKSDDVGRRAYCTVTVTDAASAQGTNPQPVNAGSIKVGATKQLEGTSVTWRSEDPSIADVDASGLVTAYATTKTEQLEANSAYDASATNDPAKASKDKIIFENGKVKYDAGSVNIYATAADGTVTTYELTVTEADSVLHDIVLSDTTLNIAAGAGNAKTITVAVLPSKLMDAEVEWSSDTPAVATVTKADRTVEELNAATITGVSAGTAKITASYGGKTAECNVTVTAGTVNVSGITVTGKDEIDIDEVAELSAAVAPENATDSELLWLSSDASIVSVNNDGMIQGLKNGSATIYAVAADQLSPEQRTALEELKYNRTVSASDIAALTYGSIEITVKNSSPYLRNLNGPAEAVTSTSVNLLWNSSSKLDIADLAGYNVYVDGTKVAEKIDKLGYTADGLTAGTAYTFKVEAVKSDNTVLETATLQVTTKAAPTQINVTAAPYNAKGDGVHTDTYAIQRAIDACPEGGEVVLPAGKIFLSGALYLKSNMTFKVDGILLGSVYSKDYPFHVTRWEGWRKVNQTGSAWANTTASLPDNHYAHSSLINAGVYDEGVTGHTGHYNVENIIICGSGQINGNGFKLGYNEGVNQKTGDGGLPVPMTPAIDQTIRGRLITVHNADGLYMKDVQAAYGPSWTIHPIYSRNMTFDNLDVVSKGSGKTGAADNICILNGDGLDPDSSVKVNIFNTYFYAGDDAIAIKTGRNKEGNDLDKPTQFIRVTDSESNTSKGGFAVGSENASGVKNLLFQNLKTVNPTLSHGIWFKTYWSRGGLSEDIIVRDITSTKPLNFSMVYSTSENNPADSVPEYRYITVENSNASVQFCGIGGGTSSVDSGRTYSASYVNNVTVRGVNSGSIERGKNFVIYDSPEANWSAKNSENIVFDYWQKGKNTNIQIKDGTTAVNVVDNTNHTVSVAAGATNSEVIAALESIVPDNTVTMSISGTTLTVTASDGTTTQDYTIIQAVFWDFRKAVTEKTTFDTVESGYITYEGAELHGNGSSDYVDTTTGFHINGVSTTSNKRYVKFTAPVTGSVTITAKQSYNNAKWVYSTNSSSVSGTEISLPGVSISAWATGSFNVTQGTTYYLYCSGSGMEIQSMSFVEE